MELKNNYKVIYEVFDSAKQERTFYASKDNDINPERDVKVAGPIKVGTYKVVYEKGNSLVGIKEYGEKPVEIVDLTDFTEEGAEPSLKEIEAKIEDRLVNQGPGYYSLDEAGKQRTNDKQVIIFNPFNKLTEIKYTNVDGVKVIEDVDAFGGDNNLHQFRINHGFRPFFGGQEAPFYAKDGVKVENKFIAIPGVTDETKTKSPKLEYIVEGYNGIIETQKVKDVIENVIASRVNAGEKDFDLKATAKVIYYYLDGPAHEYVHEYTCPVKFEETPDPDIPGAISVKTSEELVKALKAKETKIQIAKNMTLGNGKDSIAKEFGLNSIKGSELYTGTKVLTLADKSAVGNIKLGGTVYVSKNYGSTVSADPISQAEGGKLTSVIYTDFDNTTAQGAAAVIAKVSNKHELETALAIGADCIDSVELTNDIDLDGVELANPEHKNIITGSFKIINGKINK